MKKDLIIFGTGATARMALYYFENEANFTVKAFTVDSQFISGDDFCGRPLVAFEEIHRKFPPSDYSMFIGIGYTQMNLVRESKYDAAKGFGYSLASFVSPRANVLSTEPIGDNCLIMEGNTIQPWVRIGQNVIMWSGNHVGHDSTIEDHCFLTSHVVVSGFVRVGHHSFLGVNATLRDGITIAPFTLIGAGAVILRNTEERGVYVPPRTISLDKKSTDLEIS
jgi:sugar O-acyltransferase (sialic acid O-acetyltransferase NeuD family)